jgi:predicted nuclease of restriction endonuclease-like (RecB) superfamily
VEQAAEARAGYGEQVLDRVAARLTKAFGKGFSPRTLRRLRQFYLTYPGGSVLPPELGGPEKRSALLSRSSTEEIRSALLSKSSASRELLFPAALGWSHYLILTRVENEHARTFYEIEAVRENWSTRELERQIASLLYERLAKSREKDAVLALAREGHRVAGPRDILKDPVVLEFLELEERSSWLERDLEQAIIDRIEGFLLELKKGFCFVARQKRLTLAQDHFYVDLVFYNRLLRCFVREHDRGVRHEAAVGGQSEMPAGGGALVPLRRRGHAFDHVAQPAGVHGMLVERVTVVGELLDA